MAKKSSPSSSPARIHVTPSRNGDTWSGTRPGAARASVVAPTQAAVVDRTRTILERAGGGELVIHGRDGRIRDSDTVGGAHDPFPPKDKK